MLNSNPCELSVHNWLYPMNECMEIIAAKLVHNPKYAELGAINKNELEGANPICKKEFEGLVELLSSVL